MQIFSCITNKIYAEVEIPKDLNLRPLVDKTLIASKLELIMLSSDVDVFSFLYLV